MKIKQIHLEQYKRFTDLSIQGIPESTKLVVLLGPNGCGKSSLFDAFKTWHLMNGYSRVIGEDYCKKDIHERRSSYELVNINFYRDMSSVSQADKRQFFYFRTAYRNSPNITISALSKVESPLERADTKKMIENDSTVDDNYQRLISETISQLYNIDNDNKSVKSLRDELLDKIRVPLNRLFPELELTGIGLVTDKPEFYFSKGTTKKYGYEKLSGGEKAAFDLLLDFVIKSQFFRDTIFCIDEPETHIHTSLQARLLLELFRLIPDQSQMWIATHSFGMLKEARILKQQHPDEVVFLNFDCYDFDEPATIEPSECDTTLWNKMLEITLDDYAALLTPETIVFCEGTSKGRKRKDFDARCYQNIFSPTHPSTLFYSLGSCEDVEKSQFIIEFIAKLSPTAKVIRVVDRDDRSPEEIADLQKDGIKVLPRRHSECFLLDDDVLQKWCDIVGQSDKKSEILLIKSEKMKESIARGNPEDDVKSAANDICIAGKVLLKQKACGNNGESIMRDTLSKLITPDMAVYSELENAIFG